MRVGHSGLLNTGEEVTKGVDLVIAAIGQHLQTFAGFGIGTDARAEGSRCPKCNLAAEISSPVMPPAA